MKILELIVNVLKKIWFFIEAVFVTILEKVFSTKPKVKYINVKDLGSSYKNLRIIESDVSATSIPENLTLCLKRLLVFKEEITEVKKIPYLSYNRSKNSKQKYDVLKLEEYINKLIITVNIKIDTVKIKENNKNSIEKNKENSKNIIEKDKENNKNSIEKGKDDKKGIMKQREEQFLDGNEFIYANGNHYDNYQNGYISGIRKEIEDVNLNSLAGDNIVLCDSKKIAISKEFVEKLKENNNNGINKEKIDIDDVKLSIELIKNSILKEENINLQTNKYQISSNTSITYSLPLWERIKQVFRNIFHLPRFKNKHIRSLTGMALLNNSLIGTRKSLNKKIIVKYITTEDIVYYLTDTKNVIAKSMELCYDAKSQVKNLKQEVSNHFYKDIANMEEVKKVFIELDKIDLQIDKKMKELKRMKQKINKRETKTKVKVLKYYRKVNKD